MATVLPPGAQAPPPQPAVTAQAAPTAVVRNPSVELLRLAAGTRVEGTVQPPPPPPSSPQVDVVRTTVQTPQNAAVSRSDTPRPAPPPAPPAQAQAAAPPAPQAPAPPAPQPAPQTPAPPAPAPSPQATAPPTPQAPTPTPQATAQLAPQTPQPAPQPATPPPQARPAAPTPQSPVVQVRTPVGDVTLRTPLPLPEGARVAFDIVSSKANQVTVRFASLNGQPIQQALVQLAADRAAAPPPGLPPALGPAQPGSSAALTFGQAWTPNGPLALTQAGPLNAFVLNGTTVPGQAVAQTGGAPIPGLLTGADLSLRITGVSPAQPGVTPQLTVTTPGVQAQQAAPGTPATGQGTAAATAGQPIAAATSGATTATPTTPQAAGQGTAQSNAQTPPQGPGSTLPAGGNTQSGLRLVSAQGWPPPPFATPTQTQGAPVQLTMTGIVTAQSTVTQPMIQTAAGTLQLASPANVPPGSVVTLEILSQTTPRADAAATAPPASTGTLPFAAGATPWPTLTEALQLLQRADPQAAQMLANTLPDGGPRTVVAAMSFIQAMRGGDLRQWPGDNNLRALERTGPRGAHLARTLSSEVAQLSAQSRETAGEWRTTPLPWNAQGQIEKISLITRREESAEEDDDETEKRKGAGLRFLLDLDLSQLGELQLDGMVHEDSKSFDMMIRSHAPLDETIRLDLTGLFVAANQAVGLKGGLTFQVTQKFADPLDSKGSGKNQKDGVWA